MDTCGSYTQYLKKRDKNANGESGNGKLIINPNGCSFFLTATGPDEIAKIIERLDVFKSAGPFGIPTFLLKSFKDFFSIWLSELINLCFETGEFPTLIKMAKVTPQKRK